MKRRNLNVRSRQVTNVLRSKRSGLTEGGDRMFLRNFYMQLKVYAAQKLARHGPNKIQTCSSFTWMLALPSLLEVQFIGEKHRDLVQM